jgi:hypothetical protein
VNVAFRQFAGTFKLGAMSDGFRHALKAAFDNMRRGRPGDWRAPDGGLFKAREIEPARRMTSAGGDL